MSKTKKITFNMIASDMKRNGEAIVRFNGINNEYEIGVKTSLGFREAMGFIRDVVASCCDMDAGVYSPEGFDFALRVNTLVYYAGFTAPTDIDKAYDVAYCSGLFESVIEVIDQRQFDEMVGAINSQLRYSRGLLIASQSSKMNELINKMDEVMTNGDRVMSELEGGKLEKKLNDMMKTISVLGSGESVSEDIADETPSNIIEMPRGDDR